MSTSKKSQQAAIDSANRESGTVRDDLLEGEEDETHEAATLEDILNESLPPRRQRTQEPGSLFDTVDEDDEEDE